MLVLAIIACLWFGYKQSRLRWWLGCSRAEHSQATESNKFPQRILEASSPVVTQLWGHALFLPITGEKPSPDIFYDLFSWSSQ